MGSESERRACGEGNFPSRSISLSMGYTDDAPLCMYTEEYMDVHRCIDLPLPTRICPRTCTCDALHLHMYAHVDVLCRRACGRQIARVSSVYRRMQMNL